MRTDLPILYSFRRCPYAMRARAALLVSEQQVCLREIILSKKPEHMLTISPKGTVPVLLLTDGTVIDESLEIMLWTLQRSDPKGWLKPSVGTLDDALALISKCDGEFKTNLDRFKYADKNENADPVFHRTCAEIFLEELETRLVTTRFLCGKTQTLADQAIMPFVRQFAGAAGSWFNTAPYPATRAWLNALIAAPMFDAIMAKVEPWQENSPEIILS